MLNAVEPGTVVPIHRHPTKDESFVILRGKVRVTTHNDDGAVIGDVVLSRESGCYGVDVSGGVFWPQWGSKRRRDQKEYERMLEEGRVKS